MYCSPSTQVGMINPILQMSKLRLLCFLREKVATQGARTSGLLPESPEGLRLSALPQPPPQTTTQSCSSSHPCAAELGLSR